MSTDAQIEARLDTMIQALTGISDSKNSKTKKLSRMKEVTIRKALRKDDRLLRPEARCARRRVAEANAAPD